MTCSWPVSYDQCGPCEPLASSPVSGLFEEMAVDYLRQWTSPLLGLCDVTIRPCREDCTEGQSTFWGSGPFPSGGAGPFRPVIIEGQWFNLTCGTCGDRCSCGHVEELKLPGPVASIQSIQIDGVAVPSGAYRVDNNRYLVRTDDGVWPECQDMGKNDGVVGTWSITYSRGIPVPVHGQVAAGVLACEFARAACGDSACQLPKRLQSLTRQGVSVAILDSFDDIDSGHTGIWLIDSFIASMTKPKRGGSVRSPDLVSRGRGKTWP
jgi:hypothetical protein